MEKSFNLQVQSEVGKLEAVLLHRPGKELERLTPQYLEELLFDDIPWLVRMREEHDQFAQTLRDRGCMVLYYDVLLEEILRDGTIRDELIHELSVFTGIEGLKEKDAIIEYLDSRTSTELAEILIAGLHKNEINHTRVKRSLSYYISEDYPFYINPLPNLYFTRDPGAVIGHGLSIHSMKTAARNREPMILSYIFRYHKIFQTAKIPLWHNYKNTHSIEGGDILVLSDKVVAVGCSARTSSEAIETLAENLFQGNSGIREVLAIQIPFKREYMHLDTVFTMLDVNKFTMFPAISNKVKVFSLSVEAKNGIRITSRASLQKALCLSLERDDIAIIQSGGGDRITAAREQWNDSTNTLAIAPGCVVTYSRNQASNNTLRMNGMEVVEIEGSELVRGRGGPRCMSMPLRRAPVN